MGTKLGRLVNAARHRSKAPERSYQTGGISKKQSLILGEITLYLQIRAENFYGGNLMVGLVCYLKTSFQAIRVHIHHG